MCALRMRLDCIEKAIEAALCAHRSLERVEKIVVGFVALPCAAER